VSATLGEHPEVVPEDQAPEDVDEVVPAAEDQHQREQKEDQGLQVGKKQVSLHAELTDVDDAQTHNWGEIEGIRISVGD
jgi:hypothetical protein